MGFFDKFLNLFKKNSSLEIISEDTKLYNMVKENMDNFEKNVIIDNIKVLSLVIKQMAVEHQILKEAISTQNQVLHNLVAVNQKIISLLTMIPETTEDYELQDLEEDDITETALERSNREMSKKFGAN